MAIVDGTTIGLVCGGADNGGIYCGHINTQIATLSDEKCEYGTRATKMETVLMSALFWLDRETWVWRRPWEQMSPVMSAFLQRALRGRPRGQGHTANHQKIISPIVGFFLWDRV